MWTARYRQHGTERVPHGQAELELELRVQAHRRDRDGSAVAIVGRVIDPLIIEAEVRRGEKRERIVSLDDLLRTGMRQAAVAHQDAEAARIQVTLARGGNAVVDRGEPQRVGGAMPGCPAQRQSRGYRPVDIR